MKEIEFQLENKDKEIIKSNKIKIDENEDRIKVIVSIGSEDFYGEPVTVKMIGDIHDMIVNSIKNGNKVITIPSFVKINTIKI